MKTRIEVFLNELRQECSDNEIAAGFGNGDIELPEWISKSEDTDHVKIWDSEDGDCCARWGFYTIAY